MRNTNITKQALIHVQARMIVILALAVAFSICAIVSIAQINSLNDMVATRGDAKCIYVPPGTSTICNNAEAAGSHCYLCIGKQAAGLNDTIFAAPIIVLVVAVGLLIWTSLYCLCCQCCNSCLEPKFIYGEIQLQDSIA